MIQFRNNPKVILLYGLNTFYGFIVSRTVREDFFNLYISIHAYPPIRYSLILCFLLLDYFVISKLNHSIFILRSKSVFTFLMKLNGVYLLLSMGIVVCFNLPILLMNFASAMLHITLIVSMSLNAILIAMAIISAVHLLDVWIKNRIKSCAIILVLFIIGDVVMDHLGFFESIQFPFGLNELFILPILKYNYLVLFFVIATILIFVNLLTVYLMIRKDYLLGNDKNEVQV